MRRRAWGSYMAFNKIPKVVAVYFPKKYVGKGDMGTRCGTCRDYIPRIEPGKGFCAIVDDPAVSGTRGTCTQYIRGSAPDGAQPMLLIPKALVGYIEGDDVPSYCGRCKHYEHPGSRTSECAKVGDYEGDVVEYAGCCNGYESREKSDD